jgi:hypothetical protein
MKNECTEIRPFPERAASRSDQCKVIDGDLPSGSRSVNRSAGLLLGVLFAFLLGGLFHAFTEKAEVTPQADRGVAGGNNDHTCERCDKQEYAFHGEIL